MNKIDNHIQEVCDKAHKCIEPGPCWLLIQSTLQYNQNFKDLEPVKNISILVFKILYGQEIFLNVFVCVQLGTYIHIRTKKKKKKSFFKIMSLGTHYKIGDFYLGLFFLLLFANGKIPILQAW